MRRWWKWPGVIAVFAAALVFLLFQLANIQSGQNFFASLVGPLSEGRVSIKGLSGRFPAGLRAQELVISDDVGPWLVFHDVAVEGSVLSLIRNRIDFTKATAARLQVLRLPMVKSSNPSMPRIDIAVLDVPELETSAELSSVPMRFAAHGALHMQSVRNLAADLALRRLDGSGSYQVSGSIRDGQANGIVKIDEARQGFFTGFLRLNDIGPIRAEIRGEGPADANTVTFVVDAGRLHASGRGTSNLVRRDMNLDFAVSAPAMDVRQDLSWQSLKAEGHARGSFDTLALDMRLTLDGVRGNDASAKSVSVTAKGTAGEADFNADVAGLEIAGLEPKFFAGAPVRFVAHANLRGAKRPIAFTLTHPLLKATGTTALDGPRSMTANVTLPNLRPYGRFAELDIAGQAVFAARVSLSDNPTTAHIALDGKIAATGGDPIAIRLIGRDAPFKATADLSRAIVRNLRVNLKGPKAQAELSGTRADGKLDVALSGRIADASLIVPDLKGEATFNATAKGPLRSAKLAGTIKGTFSASGLAPQRISLDLQGTGLPKPAGTFRGEGEYQNAPLSFAGTFGWSERGIRVAIEKGQWKSAMLKSDAVLVEGTPFTGGAKFEIAQLADLAPLVGTAISGSADGTIDLQRQRGQAVLTIKATGHAVGIQDAKIATLSLSGDVQDPFAKPRLALKATAAGLSTTRLAGNATADIAGPLDALAVKSAGEFKDANGRPIKLDASLTYRQNSNQVALSTLAIDYFDIKASLVRPVTVTFRDGISVDRLELKSGDGALTFSGRLTPTLAADLDLQNVSAKTLRPYFPNLSQGVMSGKAQLTGTIDAPRGTMSFEGRELRFRNLLSSVDAGTLQARADLDGQVMQIDASLVFGRSKLGVTGQAPLAPNGMFNLHATGTADLSVLSAALTAEGRQAVGQATLDASLSGTRDSPNIGGTLKLANAEYQDYVRGLRVTGIAANAAFRGKSLEIVNFTGRAGAGTISGKGTVDVLAEGAPVNVSITARNAEPFSGDTFHANLDADLKVTGSATRRLLVAGTVTVRRGESILPNKLPPAVASIKVIRAGEAVPAPPSMEEPGIIALDLTVSSQGLFFVRGRGLEAELQGRAHVGGTVSSPVVTGGFEMRRGSFDLGSATLNFTTGKVTFVQDSLRDRVDPALDFVAESMSGGYTARLEVGGTVSNPKVELTSTPTMPQDEILAQLLFQQNVKQLSALQLASMGQAAAAIGGFGTGLNPLASIRKTLGLDRLSVVTGADNQTELEAGKYVSRNVYVGAKQGLSTTPQAEVQIDLTKSLKAKATVATGTNATVTQGAQQLDSGSSIGLSWQFEY